MEEIDTLKSIYQTELVLQSSEPTIQFELIIQNATANFEIDLNSDQGKIQIIKILGTQNNTQLQQDLQKFASENNENGILFKLCQMFKDSVENQLVNEQSQEVKSVGKIQQVKQDILPSAEGKPLTEQQLFGKFIEALPIQSILCFSEIMMYYGGKRKIRILLSSMSRGASIFYNNKVRDGRLFLSNVKDTCHLVLNEDFEVPDYWSKYKLLSGISVDFINCRQIEKVVLEHRQNNFQLVKARNVETDSLKAILALDSIVNLNISLDTLLKLSEIKQQKFSFKANHITLISTQNNQFKNKKNKLVVNPSISLEIYIENWVDIELLFTLENLQNLQSLILHKKKMQDDLDMIWPIFCQWIEYHKELRRLVITNFDFKLKNLKQLKSALAKSTAPLVEVDFQECTFENSETKKRLDEFIQDHYGKFQSKNYWAKARYYKKIVQKELSIFNDVQMMKSIQTFGYTTDRFSKFKNMRDLISLTINENQYAYKFLANACEDKSLNPQLKYFSITSAPYQDQEQQDFLDLIEKMTINCIELQTLMLKVGLNKNFSRSQFQILRNSINKTKYLSSLYLPVVEVSPFVLDCISSSLDSLISLQQLSIFLTQGGNYSKEFFYDQSLSLVKQDDMKLKPFCFFQRLIRALRKTKVLVKLELDIPDGQNCDSYAIFSELLLKTIHFVYLEWAKKTSEKFHKKRFTSLQVLVAPTPRKQTQTIREGEDLDEDFYYTGFGKPTKVKVFGLGLWQDFPAFIVLSSALAADGWFTINESSILQPKLIEL